MIAEQITTGGQIRKVTSSNSLATTASDNQVESPFKKYTKITNQVKEDFLDLIINQNCSIKRAAERLNINYSSAKTIISAYREKNRKKFKGPSRFHKRAGFREAEEADVDVVNYTLATSVGGVEMECRPIVFAKSKLIKKVRVVTIIPPVLL